MDLSTTYMGLKLRSPLVVGAAAPLTEDINNIVKIAEAGAAAVVLHSLFEEQLDIERLELEHHLSYGTESFPEALTYFPQVDSEIFHVGSQQYLDRIRQAKETVNIPIIASLNGSSLGGWCDYARSIEQAGADALELNIYYIPTDLELSGTDLEQAYLDIVAAVKSQVTIPVAIKLSPYFSNTANMAKKLSEAGADALVLFNRFYQPDIDAENLEVRSNILLSTPQDLRLPMRWIAILYGRIEADLAATSGIHKATDAIKMLMAGASITQLVSVLLRHGFGQITAIETQMKQWLLDREYESLSQLRGSMSQLNCADKDRFERVQYVKALQTYSSLL
ncbi:MAG: dihydroorotate dehydrogenase-like protein [Prochloraceae cyanobacterium]|nr:dihydroorotate dehydrogenase-like protein [Prochloraceae cyanobacterium]